VNLNRDEYRSKVLGCWLGKNIGGTLGAPFEWRRQVNQVSFYTQDLGGEPRPNDDLDIQLLWLVALEERGVDLDAHALSEYWCLYVTPHWSEYGTAKVNMRSGLQPPLSGTYGNDYKDSCGAFIRSEIWACIAPGAPQVAARYAYEDAILDHGAGEGTYAEVFCAALESAAFVEPDIHALIDVALSYIPADCGVAGAVRCALDAYQGGKTWLEARDAVLEGYRGSTFFGFPEHTSAADRAKGFDQGRRGWDAPSNIGMLLIGLLYGEGEFDASLCTAVNCGEDTDCTGATVGSIFGILHGADAIPERWIAPIGHTIKTACLNLGELGYFGNQLPATVEALTERTMRVAHQVAMRQRLPVQIGDGPTDLSGLQPGSLAAGPLRERLYENLGGPVYRFADFRVGVDYGEEGPLIRPGVPKAIVLRIRNTYKVQANLGLHWYLPEGWRVAPAADGALLALPAHLGAPLEVAFTLEADAVRAPMNRAVVELTIAGRPTAMLVPVTLLNGSLDKR
jgi:ADP-ribosylglycohydrolase